jgi:uncharacterized protein (DUF1330 family)
VGLYVALCLFLKEKFKTVLTIVTATQRGEPQMAIIVKAQITITKGFDTWQAMVKSQDARMQELGIKFLFAGTEKDNPNQLHAIMMFPSMEALQAFGGDEELTEIRRQAGAVIESGVMTPISGDYFTNYPEAHIKH